MSDREPKDWQRKLKKERHVHFVDIMDESRRAPPFDHFPITPSRRGGPIRRLLLKVIPCYSDREIKYLYQEKEAEPKMKEIIGEDHKTGKNNRKREKEYKNIKTKEDRNITKDKIDYENKIKDVTKHEKKNTAEIRRSTNSSSLGPSTSAEVHNTQRKPKADRRGKRAQKTWSASQRRSMFPSWRPLPPLPRKASRKQKTALQEDFQQARNEVEKQEKSPQLSGVRSPRYPPTAARERRRNSSEFLWRQMRYQQQKIGFILRDKAKERRQAELADANPKNGSCHDGVMTNHAAQPMAQVESRMSCVSANHHQMNQTRYPSRDEILNIIAQTCSQSAQDTKRSIELLELNACAQNDMLITISQILGEQLTRSIPSADIPQHKELFPVAADTDVTSDSSYGSSTSSTQNKNSSPDELSDWEDLSSISSDSVSNYSMRRKSTRKTTTKKTYSRTAKAQKAADKRKSHSIAQKSNYSEGSSNNDICRSVTEQSEIELFLMTRRSTKTGTDKKHKRRKSKQQLTRLHDELSEDVSRTPAMQVTSDVSYTDTNLNNDDTAPSVNKGKTPGTRDTRKNKGRQRNGKPSRTVTVEAPSSESAEYSLHTLIFDASSDDAVENSLLHQKRTPQCNTRNLSEDDTPVNNVLHSPESSETAKNRGHRRSRHSSQPERDEDRPERAHPPTSIGDEGCTTSDNVSGQKRHAHKYKKSQETKCLALNDDEDPEEHAVNLSAVPSAPESTTPSVKEETLICSKSKRKRTKQNKMKRSTEPKLSSHKSENVDYSDENESLSPVRAILSTPTVDEAVFSDMPMKTPITHQRVTTQESEVAPPRNSEEPKVSTLTEDIVSNKPLRKSKRGANNRNRTTVLTANYHDDHQANEASITTQQTPVDEKSTVPNFSKEDLQIKSDPKELHNGSDSDTAKGIDMSTKRQNIEKQMKLKKRIREKRDRQLLTQKPEISLENPQDNDLSEKQPIITTTQTTGNNPPGVKSRRKEREVLDQDAILSSSPDMVHGAAQRKRKEKRKPNKEETSVTVDHEALQGSQGRLEYVALNREIREQRSQSPPEDEDSTSDDDCGFMTSVFPVKNTDTVYQINDNPSQTEQNGYEVRDVYNLTTGDDEIQANAIASPSEESKEKNEKRFKKSPKYPSSSVWKKLQHNKKNNLRKHSTDLEKSSSNSEVKHDSEMQMSDTGVDAEATTEMCRDVERQGKEEEESSLQHSDKSTTSKHKEPHKKSKTPKMLKKIAKQQGLFKRKTNQKHLTQYDGVEKPLPEEEIPQRFQDGSFETKTIIDLCQETGPDEVKKHHKNRKIPKVLKTIAKEQGLFKNKKSQIPIEPSSGTEKSKTDDKLHSLDTEKSVNKINNLCQATTWSPMGDEIKNTMVETEQYRQNEHNHKPNDVNEHLVHRKSMSRWQKFKHDQGLYIKQKNRIIKTLGEQEEPSNDRGFASLGGVKKENNTGNTKLMKITEKDTRKQKEDEKRVKKDLKKYVPADGSSRDQSTSSPHGKKNASKISSPMRGKKDHQSQISQIAPQSSEMKVNEIPLGLASCRNGVPTEVNPNIELKGGEAVREGNLMTSYHTSHNTRPWKPGTTADMNKEAEVAVGWCDPTTNKLKLSNDVTDKKIDNQTERIKRRHGDTNSGVEKFHPVNGNDVSKGGRDSQQIPTERNGHHQGDRPVGFDKSLPHDEQYKLPVNKQNSSEREEDCTTSGQNQQRCQIMNQILQELDDNSSQSDRGEDALIVNTSSRKVTETKTSQSDNNCNDDIIDEMTSPTPVRQAKLLSQVQCQVEDSADDVIPNLQRHQSKTQNSFDPFIDVTAVVEDNEECVSWDELIDQKPPASRQGKDNNVENSEHELNYNSWDEMSEEETTNQIKQGNSSNMPRSPDVEILDELLDELSPSNKKHATRQADSKLRQMAGTDCLMKERKGLNVNAIDLESDYSSLTQDAEKAQSNQSCVTELDVIEKMLSTSTGKNEFDIFEIVNRMPQSQTKPERLTSHPEKCSEVQTSEDASSRSEQPILVSDKKYIDEPLHGENKVKQCQSSGNTIKENLLPKAETEVSQNSKQPSYAPREEEIDNHPIPREEYGRSSLVIIESQKLLDEKPIDTETHTTMSTHESHTTGGKISISPAWGSALDDTISSSTRRQDVTVGSDIRGEVLKQPTTYNLNTTNDVTHDVPSHEVEKQSPTYNLNTTNDVTHDVPSHEIEKQSPTYNLNTTNDVTHDVPIHEVEKQSPTYNLNTTDDVTHDLPSSLSIKSDIFTDKDSSAHLDKTQPVTSEMKEESTGKTSFLDYLTQMKLEESLKKAGKPETISPFEKSDVPSYLRTDFNPAPDQKPFKRWDPAAAQNKMEKICRSKNKSKESSEPRWLKEDFNPAHEQKAFKKWNPVAAQKTMEKVSAKKITTEQPEPRWLKNDFNHPVPEQKLNKRWDPSAAQKKMEHIPQSKKKPTGSEPRWLQNDFNPAPESKSFKRWDTSVAQNKMEKICLSTKTSPEHAVMPRWLQTDFNPVENGRKAEEWKVPGAKSGVLRSTPKSKDSTADYWNTPDASISLDDQVQGREAIKKESQKILDSMRSQEMFHSSEKESSTKGITSTSAEVEKDIPRFLRADFNPVPEQTHFKRWDAEEAKQKLVKIGDSKEQFPNNSEDEKPPWLKIDLIQMQKEAKRGASYQPKTHEADLINSTTKETAKDASIATPRWLQPHFDPAADAIGLCVSEPSKRTSHMPPAEQFQYSVLGQPTYQPRSVKDIQGQHADPSLRERSLPVDNSPQWTQPGFHGVPDQPHQATAFPPDALQSQVKALDKSSNVPAWLHSKPQPPQETTRNKPNLPGVSSMTNLPTHQHDMDSCKTDGRLGRRTFKQFALQKQMDGSSLPPRSLDVISSEIKYEDSYPSGMGHSELPRPSWIKPGLFSTENAWQDSANERRILLNSISQTQARFTNRIK